MTLGKLILELPSIMVSGNISSPKLSLFDQDMLLKVFLTMQFISDSRGQKSTRFSNQELRRISCFSVTKLHVYHYVLEIALAINGTRFLFMANSGQIRSISMILGRYMSSSTRLKEHPIW